jgi:hypothetical protein
VLQVSLFGALRTAGNCMGVDVIEARAGDFEASSDQRHLPCNLYTIYIYIPYIMTREYKLTPSSIYF